MSTLTSDQKKMLIRVAISTISDEFFRQHGRHSELGELPDFADTIGANTSAILALLDEKNTELPWPISQQIAEYSEFFDHLSRNLELERIPRRNRPDRSVD